MSLKKLPVHSDNPFKKSGIEAVPYNAGSNEVLVVNPDDGEAYGLRRMKSGGYKYNDKRKFRKIYTDTFDLMKEINRPAMKVFCYILKNLVLKSDSIKLVYTDVATWCEFKEKKSYYEGLCELIDKRFIARSSDNKKYYINTNLFFNGDRTQSKNEE